MMQIELLVLWAAFSAGLFGSPHCIGMCGGIVNALNLSISTTQQRQRHFYTLLYHFGRLTIYSFLGLMAGFLGQLLTAHLHKTPVPRIVLAVVLIFMGLHMLGMPFLNRLEKVGQRVWLALSPVRKRIFPIDSPSKAFAIGLVWGFLPCGLVYSSLTLALSSQNPYSAALLMFVFGLGTLPLMLLTSFASHKAKHSLNKYPIRQINGVLLIVSALWILSPIVLTYLSHRH